MSKAALRKLATHLAESDPKKDYRNKTINTLTHAIDLNLSSISREIQAEVLATDPVLDSYLTSADYKKASSIIRAHIQGKVHNPKSSLRQSPDDHNIIIANTFGAVSTVLKEASDKVLEYFQEVLAKKNINYTSDLGAKGKIINLDHTRTVSETRIGRDLYRVSGLDPVKLISELQRKSYLTRAKRTEVFENVLEILSYYKGNQKVFEIKGSVAPDDKNPITGKIASASINQVEGAEIIKGRVNTFRQAVEAAIKDVKWDEQQASDSYQDYIMKTLNNAAIKAGAKGTKQKIDTKSNKEKTSKKVKTEVVVRQQTTRPRVGVKRSNGIKPPLLSLQTINDYINARLPEQVRSNMGPATLVNRTGRFSESARMVNATLTAQGHPSLGYTYQRSPYDVFDPILGRAPWNTPGRNPRPLIEKSIREIAAELAIGRFYLRRV